MALSAVGGGWTESGKLDALGHSLTVHYMNRTIDRAFAPGTRVRTVKQWAVRELKLNPTDAGEHVLQLCNTTTQPPTDAALAELVNGQSCDVCFDLVPEKRIEG